MQPFTRSSIKNPKSLEKRNYREFENAINELKKYLTDQEGMSGDMEKIREILLKNKKSTKINFLSVGNYGELKNYIAANSI